jgi:HPt (histidine-containing phosphotransfer) domain-containing protein
MSSVGRSTSEASEKSLPIGGRTMGGNNDSDPVLDLHGALTRLGSDKELFAELARYVLEDAPPLYKQLASAIAANDPEDVRFRAHALKGLVAGCGGVRTAKVAQQLEDAGSAANLNQAKPLLATLKSELDELTRALQQPLR